MTAVRLAILAAVLVITGCASNPRYKIQHADLARLQNATHAFVEYRGERAHQASVDVKPDPSAGTTISNSAYSAANGYVPPGGSAQGQAVGALIGAIAMSAIQDSKEQAEANTRAEAVNQMLGTMDVDGLVYEALFVQQEKVGHINLVPQELIENYEDPVRIRLQPEIRFSNDMSRLKIKLDVEFFDHGSRDRVYGNTFEYWSKPMMSELITSTGEVAPGAEVWSLDDGELLTTTLLEGIAAINELIRFDIYTQADVNELNRESVSIRYQAPDGLFFARGVLLEAENERIVYRDLRGNLRSVYGVLPDPAFASPQMELTQPLSGADPSAGAE